MSKLTLSARKRETLYVVRENQIQDTHFAEHTQSVLWQIRGKSAAERCQASKSNQNILRFAEKIGQRA